MGCRFTWINWEHCELHAVGLAKNPADGAARCMAHFIAAKPQSWYLYAYYMCANPNPLMTALALQDPSVLGEMELRVLSANENEAAVDYLLAHPERINFREFSVNGNDRAFRFLTETCADKIAWVQFVTYNQHPEKVAFCERWAAEKNVAVTEAEYYTTVRNDAWHTDYHIDDRHNEDMSYRICLVDFATNAVTRRQLCDHADEDDIQSFMARVEQVEKKGGAIFMGEMLWTHFSSNPHDRAVESLLQDPRRIVWSSFCANPNPIAVDFLKQNLHKVAPYLRPRLFSNPNPELLRYMMEEEHHGSERAIPWYDVLANPAIFHA